MKCNICSHESAFFSKIQILEKYVVSYFICPSCGYLQTEEPFWLKEAYEQPINKNDTGMLTRNFNNARITNMVILALFNKKGKFLDYGGGYGIFVRLMRDKGREFYWYDTYCTNLFAKDFEHRDVRQYDLVTAFEVFEHLPDPLKEFERLFSLGENLLLTTECLPFPVPDLDKWWYYGLEHGQHISLFTRQALVLIAKKFGRHYYHSGSFHLFTKNKVSPLFYILSKKPIAAVLDDIIYP